MSIWRMPPEDVPEMILDTFLPSRQANAIVDFIHHPCAAPWFVYVEALVPALFELVLFLGTQEPEDVAKSQLKRGTSHIARQRRTAVSRHKPNWKDKANRYFWLLDDAIERPLFWWAIVDMGIDAAYKWTTVINETAYCTGGGLFHSYAPSGSYACADGWTSFPVNHLLQNTNNWPWTSVNVSPGGGPTFALITMEPRYNSVFNVGSDFQIRCGKQVGPFIEWTETEPVQLSVGDRTNVSVSMHFENHVAAPGTVVWQWRQNPGLIPLVDYGRVDVIVGQQLPSPT